MADLFLSYSRRDGEFVHRLARTLEERGKDLWVDMDDIGPAAPWRDEIQRGLEGCDGFVFVISPTSVASVECGAELALAVTLSKRIVPVVHVDVDSAEVPDALARLNWIRIREGDDFDAGVAQLVEALEQDLDWVREHTRLGERAEEWLAHDRSNARLLRGSDLSAAEAMVTSAAGKDPALSAHQLAYVAAGRGAARRRQRWLLGSVTMALVVAVALSVVALHERGTAVMASHRAQSRQLAADAEVQLGTDPELSVLLAEHAYDIDPTAESVATLRHALVSSFIRMRVQPDDGVSLAQLTPDGATLVTLGRSDGVVRRWSYPGGKSLGALPGVVADAGQVAVNPADGRVLVADGGKAEVYTGTHRDLQLGSEVTAIAWDPTGGVVVTGTTDGRVVLYDGKTGNQDGYAYGLKGPVQRVAESADDQLAAASDGHRVLLVDFRTTPVQVHLPRTDGPCPELLFSPDGSRLLAYGGDACSSVLLDTTTGRPVPGYSNYAIGAAAFAPDDRALVVGGAYAVSLDPATGAMNGQYLGHAGPVAGAAFVAAGSGADDFVATAGVDGTIRVWEAVNPASTAATLRADETALASITVTPDGRHLVTVDQDQRTARVWADPLPTPQATVGDPSGTGVNGPLTDAALSPDGRLILAQDDAGLALHDAVDGSAGRVLDGSSSEAARFSAPGSIGFVADGTVAFEATASGVRAWRTTDGEPLPGYRLPDDADGEVPALEVPASGSGRLLVGLGTPAGIGSAAQVDHLDLVDLTTGATTRLSDRPVTAAAVSPDGTRAAFVTDQGVTVRSGGHTRTVGSAPVGATHLAFSGDGARLVVADKDTLRVVTTDTGHSLVTVTLPGVEMTSVALDRAGDRVAAGGDDGRARLWTVPSGRLLMTGTETSQPDSATAVDVVRLDPDGGFLLSGVTTSDTKLWDAADGVRLYAWPSTYAGWSPSARRVLTVLASAATWTCPVCVDGSELRALADRSTTRALTAAEESRYLTP